MTILEAIERRHSVRRYLPRALEPELISALNDEIAACNAEGGMDIRLVTDEAAVFNGLMAKIVFKGAKNYIVLAGPESPELDEKAGYFGERIVIKAQQLGLNTCWAAMFSGKKYSAELPHGERIVIIISVGYGETQGVPHKSKPLSALCKAEGEMPDWFRAGMEAVLLAPSAINRQPFMFTLSGDTVHAEPTGGVLAKIDCGIAKYHFEVAAGKENFRWK
ncbi:MAG: nitroreductase [Oscillospiraceae bacterium]|jgi:nitroreductase|nr:nitroreductase [Oscillospiraceae bacterium]